MNKFFFYALFSFIVNSACSQLDTLNTDLKKEKYLSQIFNEDQKLRKQISETKLEFGMESKEYKNMVKKIQNQDSLNTVKITNYLYRFGYPSKKVVGEIAAYTPIGVLHHSGDVVLKKQLFPFFYFGYKNEDIKYGVLQRYLDRLYIYEFNKKIDFEFKEFNRSNEIREYVIQLELDVYLPKHLK